MTVSSGYIIGEIYGEALYQLAQESGLSDGVLTDLKLLSDLLQNERDFLKLLTSPTLKDVEKAVMVRQVFKERVSDLTLDFMCVLARRNRMAFLAEITNSYEELLDQSRNYFVVEVTLAKRFEEVELERLRQQVKDAIRAEVKLRVHIDSDILGGIIIKRGDLMIDNSVRAVLSRAVSSILERSKEKGHKRSDAV